MEKEEVYKELKDYRAGSKFVLRLNRGNGIHPEIYTFDGFDRKKVPIFSFEDGTYLDLNETSIESLTEKCPEKFCKYFSDFEKFSIHKLIWDRGNGKLEEFVRFDGFDKEENPILVFCKGESVLNVKKMGGYDSILSVQEECPDGYCVSRKSCSGCDIGHTC